MIKCVLYNIFSEIFINFVILGYDMEKTQETDTTSLISDINDIAIQDTVVTNSVIENEAEPSSSEQGSSYEILFDQLKENNKHIFVLSTAGKPIYTR